VQVFSEGDVITILDNSDAEGWWQGDLNGVQGWFPRYFRKFTFFEIVFFKNCQIVLICLATLW